MLLEQTNLFLQQFRRWQESVKLICFYFLFPFISSHNADSRDKTIIPAYWVTSFIRIKNLRMLFLVKMMKHKKLQRFRCHAYCLQR